MDIEKVLGELPKVVFYEADHAYYWKDIKLTSVTTLLKKWQYEFEKDYWLISKSIKFANEELWKQVKLDNGWKSLSKPPQEFLGMCRVLMSPRELEIARQHMRQLAHEWEMKRIIASTLGTRFHKEQEEKDLAAGGRVNPFTGKFQKISLRPDLRYCDNACVQDDLSNLPDGYYPEFVNFLVDEEKKIGIAGMGDMKWLETIGKHQYIDIDDHKTNWDKRKDGGMTAFKPGLEHMRASKPNIYNLQTAIYGEMLRRHNPEKYTVRNRQVTWYKDFDDNVFEHTPFEDVSKEAAFIIDDFFANGL